MLSQSQLALAAGVEVLGGLMLSHGFVYAPLGAGTSSGGYFASGEFRRGEHSLELHYRYSLGLVTYHVGKLALTHEDYVWAIVGRRWTGAYPGFSSEPLDAFRHLLADLQRYGHDFLAGSESDFAARIKQAEALKKAASRLP